MRALRLCCLPILAAGLLSGCAFSLPGIGGAGWAASADLRRETQEVAGLLADFRRVATLPADEARKEQQAAQAAFSREKETPREERERLHLALLLTAGIGGRDDARLAALLEESPSRTAPEDSPRHQLLVLLQRLASERARLQHDDQRRADARVREAQARADEIQRKLDALLSIEHNLRRRALKP